MGAPPLEEVSDLPVVGIDCGAGPAVDRLGLHEPPPAPPPLRRIGFVGARARARARGALRAAAGPSAPPRGLDSAGGGCTGSGRSSTATTTSPNTSCSDCGSPPWVCTLSARRRRRLPAALARPRPGSQVGWSPPPACRPGPGAREDPSSVSAQPALATAGGDRAERRWPCASASSGIFTGVF